MRHLITRRWGTWYRGLVPAMVLIAVLSVLPLGRSAWAQGCTVASTGVSFGTYDPLATSSTSITGSVTVACVAAVSLAVTYSIQLGAGSGGGFGSRSLSAGVGRLGYQLYTSAGRTTVWGDGSAGTSTVSDGYLLSVGTSTRNYTIYGAVPARQMVPPGAYTDTATLLIVY